MEAEVEMGSILSFLVVLYLLFMFFLIASVFVHSGDTTEEVAGETATHEAPGTATDTGEPGPTPATNTDTEPVDAVATALAATAQDGVPFDGPLALHRQGWQRVPAEQSDRFTGEFEADGTTRPGVIERTPSGRIKVYVKDPPRRMRRRAHHGRCLNDPSDAELDPDDGWREVHFSRDPETLTDSIDYVQTLME